MTITIIDSIMGSGKTTFMIDLINKTHEEALGRSFNDPTHEAPRFLYVAPLLSEVDRISEACPGLNFRDPQPIESRKLHHLSTLIEERSNICTTHAQSWLGKFGRRAKWSFCLPAARMAADQEKL